MHINQREHKREGNVVYWFNGSVWLVRETCKTEEEAIALLEQIQRYA